MYGRRRFKRKFGINKRYLYKSKYRYKRSKHGRNRRLRNIKVRKINRIINKSSENKYKYEIIRFLNGATYPIAPRNMCITIDPWTFTRTEDYTS